MPEAHDTSPELRNFIYEMALELNKSVHAVAEALTVFMDIGV